MISKKLFYGAVFAAMPVHGYAATTLVDLGFPTSSNAGFGGFVVQSFTATLDNLAGIEILVGGSNVNQTADISIGLYSDAARANELASGTVAVDTGDATTSDLVSDIATVLWSPVALTLGETYYLGVDTTNQLVGFSAFGNPTSDVYPGGRIVDSTGSGFTPEFYETFDYFDLSGVKFYTDPDFGKDDGGPDDPSPVPLPAGAPLLLAGLAVLALRRKKV